MAFLVAVGFAYSLPKLHNFIPSLTVEYAFFAYLCVFNLHHYWTDALIWRMKDKKTLNTLIA
jgi:hypothetical protein